LTVKGTVLRSRGLDEKISLTNNFTQNLLPLFTEKRLIPVVDKVFDIGDVERAHSYLLRNQNVGKLIAKW
jgi:NADPH:quinone reductase-like Zn-dependent oxidoreductase